MTTALLSTEACVASQKGMATTWTLAGSATAYAGTLATDGYTLTASLSMIAFTTTDTDGALNCNGNVCMMGTCVETYDSAGTVVAATVVDDGNIALCHWFIIANSAVAGTAGTTGTDNEYSIVNYMTAAQWGTNGNALVGNGLMTRGTKITAAALNFARVPETKPTTVYTTQAMTQSWYQPTYAATYAAASLRRYNGGAGDGDKVKAYCAEVRDTATATTAVEATTALIPATVAGTSGVVQLTGAQALAAGAIAFGVAALAF